MERKPTDHVIYPGTMEHQPTDHVIYSGTMEHQPTDHVIYPGTMEHQPTDHVIYPGTMDVYLPNPLSSINCDIAILENMRTIQLVFVAMNELKTFDINLFYNILSIHSQQLSFPHQKGWREREKVGEREINME